MVDLSWKELIERPAAEVGSDLVLSGSPAIVKIELNTETRQYQTISAMLALKKRHLNLLKAKRAIETVIEQIEHFVLVPRVENAAALKAELQAAGFLARVDMLDESPLDIKRIRETLGVTQEQFAARFRIGIDVLQNWEQHVNEPNAVARNMLELIARHPKQMQDLLWEGV
jgi:DNA-binding transcriptional regulator YiaG